MTEQPKSPGAAAARYSELSINREPFLRDARDASRHTIPTLMPPVGHSSGQQLYRTHQSINSRGVNNLANKLLLALLPPTRKFYRFQLRDRIREQLMAGEESVINQALVKLEDNGLRRIERKKVRVHFFEASRQLIVCGNVLMHIGASGCRVINMDRYALRRDSTGRPIEILVVDRVALNELPEEIRAQVAETCTADIHDHKYDIYTWIKFEPNAAGDGGRYKECQYVGDIEIPDTTGDYPEDRFPWIAMRWSRVDGEDWGRSLVMDHYGDIVAAEVLSRSLIRSAAIAAKTVFLVNPASQTSPEDLTAAEEGGFVVGLPDDVKALQSDRYADMTVAKNTLDDIARRLSMVFLLNSSVQRSGERVTAEEIRYLASELEDALGGVYSLLSIEFQLPLIRSIVADMRADGELKVSDKTIEPTVITGIDALGRSHELARLDAFIGGALQTFGPEVMRFVKMDEYLRRRAAGLDLDTDGLILTQEEIAAQQQQAAEQQVVQAIGPQLIQAAAQNQQGTPPSA